jgi:uncharacterized protein YcbX
VSGRIHSIFRHPVKGFTPEPLEAVELEARAYFPMDRRWAVEVGPSGFDPAAPGHVSKMKFTVLARFPQLAKLKTRLLRDDGLFHIGDETGFGVDVPLETVEGREALANFLQAWLGDEAPGRLRVVFANGHRFMDHPQGHVSLINLASVRAFERAIGRPVDPLRFRANLYVDGWEPWAEDALVPGSGVQAGGASLTLFKPIVRCIATHADPVTGERDIDVVGLLREHFGRDTLGVYLHVAQGGRVEVGDGVGLP